MAVEFKTNINPEITERGIYFAELIVKFQLRSVRVEVVFSRYTTDSEIVKFFKNHTLASFGVNVKSNTKQVVHIYINPITYLSDVNKHTYEEWMISAENTTNNSIISQVITSLDSTS